MRTRRVCWPSYGGFSDRRSMTVHHIRQAKVQTTSGESDSHGWASECPDVKNYKWRLNLVWHSFIAVPSGHAKESNWPFFILNMLVPWHHSIVNVPPPFVKPLSHRLKPIKRQHVVIDCNWLNVVWSEYSSYNKTREQKRALRDNVVCMWCRLRPPNGRFIWTPDRYKTGKVAIQEC